jgi:hypothetical protein
LGFLRDEWREPLAGSMARGSRLASPGYVLMDSSRGLLRRALCRGGCAQQLWHELPKREVILDGEIVALDDEGRISFWDLMRGRGTPAYAAFDVLWLNGRDLRELPLTQRKKRLERLIPASVGALNCVPCFKAEGRELFEAACRLDLEGIVAKRKTDGYRPEISWYKIKNPTYTQTEGRRELFERHNEAASQR